MHQPRAADAGWRLRGVFALALEMYTKGTHMVTLPPKIDFFVHMVTLPPKIDFLCRIHRVRCDMLP